MSKRGHSRPMRQRSATLPVLYAGIGLQGAAVGISGLGLPYLIERFRVDKGVGGAIPGSSALGFGIGCLVGGRLADRFGRAAVVRSGLTLMFAGNVGLAASPWLWLGIGTSFANGLGSGFMEASSNAAVVDIAKERAPHALNVLHFCFGIGAVIAPLCFPFLLRITGRWWTSLIAVAAFLAATAVWSAFVALPGRPPARPAVAHPPHRQTVRRLLIVAGMIMFVYIALEFGYAQWLFTYLTEERAAQPTVASLAVSGFFLFLAGGRLITAHLSKSMSVERLLLVLSSLSLACAAVIPFVQTVPVLVFSCLLGLGFSGIFPLGIALGGRAAPGSAWAMGALVAFGAIGAMISPPLMGTIADHSGLSAAMLVIPAGCLLLVAFVLALPRGLPGAAIEPIEPLQSPGLVSHDSD